MKLYVTCRTCRERVYLTFDTPVSERNDIPYTFFVSCPTCNSQDTFTNRDVYAETDAPEAASGAIVGGLLGLILGPEGALIGAGLGSIVAGNSRENDIRAVRGFNLS